jgi:hypothetical protein
MENAFLLSLQKITKHFGVSGSPLNSLFVNLVQMQRDYLIYGLVNGKPPLSIYKTNGMAYLAGWDTCNKFLQLFVHSFNLLGADIGCDFTSGGCVQPDKVGYDELHIPFTSPDYKTQIRPLLSEMSSEFQSIVNQLASFASEIPVEAFPFFQEILDAANVYIFDFPT